MSCSASRWVVVMVAAVVLAAAQVVEGTDYYATTNSDNGLGMLDDMLQTDPSQLCHYVACQEPVSAEACPEGTVYMEGTAQFGCCGACVAFGQEGETCSGSMDELADTGFSRDRRPPTLFTASLYNTTDNVISSSLCDYGYACFKGKCFLSTTKDSCRSMLNHYLNEIHNETLYKIYRDDYRWKPSCTADGKFGPKQCIGPFSRQRCVCMDPYGNRIFGLAFPEQEELFNSMNCKCSRQAWERKQAGETSVTLHCLENGNFEPLQCEEGWCYCIDPDTAQPSYGSRVPETAMHLLPCYNQTTTGEQYLRRCDSQQHAHAKLVQAMADSGVINGPTSLTPCDQDGSYYSRQYDNEDGVYRCWDKYMASILSSSISDNYPDCQCARDRKYYADTDSIITVTCISESGEYDEHHEQNNYKYCVDEDGIRSGPLVLNNASYTLDCGQSMRCQKNGAATNQQHCAYACVLQSGQPCPREAYPIY